MKSLPFDNMGNTEKTIYMKSNLTFSQELFISTIIFNCYLTLQERMAYYSNILKDGYQDEIISVLIKSPETMRKWLILLNKAKVFHITKAYNIPWLTVRKTQ